LLATRDGLSIALRKSCILVGVSVPSEFWATSAQTLPVLALTHVIEIRALAARWKGRWGKAQKFLVVWWSLPLLAYGVTTPVCFMALRERPVPDWWYEIVLWAIATGMAFLAINPALSFVAAANSRTIARLVASMEFVGFKARVWAVRKANAQDIRVAKNKRDGFKVDVERFATLCEVIKADPTHDEAMLADATRHLTVGQDLVARSTRLYEDVLDQREKIDALVRERSQSRKDKLEDLDRLVHRAALSTQILAEIEQRSEPMANITPKPLPGD
jgi:hypothetical protein